ncbi:MAG: GNAT family N-acetyltransferase, partial [Betaproteobacteria bacterium]
PPSAGSKVSVNSGNNQRGAVSQPLPLPLVAVVTDDGANVVAGVSIEFKVTQGTGTFQNGQASYTVNTDSDGRASAKLTLGPEEGLDGQRATATLVGTSLYAGFTASGLKSGDAGNTRISGVVQDNQDAPLPKVTVRVDGTTRQAETDAQGKFQIDNAPVGPVRLVVDGSTTTVAGEWPTFESRYVTNLDQSSCEFSLVIADDFSGKGLGSRLMLSIMDVARHKGLTEIDGLVLAQNAGMLRLMKSLGFTISAYADDADFKLCSKAL